MHANSILSQRFLASDSCLSTSVGTELAMLSLPASICPGNSNVELVLTVRSSHINSCPICSHRKDGIQVMLQSIPLIKPDKRAANARCTFVTQQVPHSLGRLSVNCKLKSTHGFYVIWQLHMRPRASQEQFEQNPQLGQSSLVQQKSPAVPSLPTAFFQSSINDIWHEAIKPTAARMLQEQSKQ